MNFFTNLWRRLIGMFKRNSEDIGRVFGVELIRSDAMEREIELWDRVSSGRPPWLNKDDQIETVNMAKHISDTRAKLVALDLGIAVSGSSRAEFLQDIVDKLLKKLPDEISDALRLGGMMIKWNGSDWDIMLPWEFGITKVDSDGEITGAIFAEHISHGNACYTRLEYHRFEGGVYVVSNKAFKNRSLVGSGEWELGSRIALNQVDEWENMQEETRISGLDAPLFSYFRVPGANTVDRSSPLGLSVFANAMTELRAIDVAISRKNTEIEDSKHITFVGQAVIKHATQNGVTLPRFVQGLGMGVNDTDTTAVKEHAPSIQTDARIKDINFDLSMAGVKCGFSEGVFVLDGQTGMITATQVEADDRDTIQTIKADRDALQCAIEQAVKGADALASLMQLAPLGEYELSFNFGDITYSYEQDKQMWFSYVKQGYVPAWMYFVKFEKMTEEEAKAMQAEVLAAQTASRAPGLFQEE